MQFWKTLHRGGQIVGIAVLLLILAACNLTAPAGGQTGISGPPIVQIAAPNANATYLTTVTVNILGLVTNAGPNMDRIEILVDDTIIQTLTDPNPGGAASFSIAQTWQPTGEGEHTISITAFREDGSSSNPARVTINVIDEGAMEMTEEPNAQAAPTEDEPVPTTASNNPAPTRAVQPTAQPQRTQAPTQPRPTTGPTNPPAPTAVPASATPNTPQVTINQGVNVRNGPGTTFAVIGSLAANQTAALLGRSPDGTWFKIQYYASNNAWIAAQFATASVDVNTLDVDVGPPTPVPTATPIPFTATPIPTATIATSVNLVAGQIRLSPSEPRCNETFNITVDVANQGSTAFNGGGSLSVQDVRASDGTQAGSTAGAFGAIQPGQTVNSGNIPLTISTYHSEQHKIIVIIDPNNAVAETNETDNRVELTYTLAKANCP
jgi:uncharacterized protein YgiM (DUF1202 family)